jgi:D-amino-acid dehydrogenase
MERYAKTDRWLREKFGVAAKRYDGDALTALEPALKQGLAGGWHYELDAHLRPDKLMASWRTALERLGVSIRERCEVQGFVTSGKGARAVSTTKGEILADAFVIAAGALTPALHEHLGCQIPIQPGKGYSITMPRPGHCPKIPIILQEHHVAVTPMLSGYRLGSTMEFVGYDKTLDQRRVKVLKDAAELYLHDPYNEPIEEQWYGWRPMTYDGKPILGRTPALDNVYLAAGHNMLGLTMAPATGKLVAELVNREAPHVDPEPFSPARFK